MNMNPLLLCDAYKIGHYLQYPKNTTLVYSNFTPRKSRISGVDEVVFFGLQYFLKEYLIRYFDRNFFDVPKKVVVDEYKEHIKAFLGSDLPNYNHIESLHDLGYLPLEIKALPEGSLVPMKVPVLTIANTLPDFYWVTNFIESLISATLWQSCTSATITRQYRKLFERYAIETGMPYWFIDWQGHDFSFRGMSSLESSILSGMGHLLSFKGTDTIPAVCALEKYYHANSSANQIAGSVPATEHSVMCSGTKEGELETFRRLITEVYPTGIVSIVSDTWDLWKVCTEYLTELKSLVLSRDGKVTIRPDSGNPVKIICGDSSSDNEFARKGVVQLLWEIFGGTITETGHKLLDSHIGVIYGDSITLERAEQICKGLKDNGFASQCIYGIGSYTYQYNTRDTFGFAMKATYVEVDGVGRAIFKKPITDNGTKTSATGLLRVDKVDGVYKLTDNVTWKEETDGELKTVFCNGILYNQTTLEEVRKNLKSVL